MPTNQSNPFYDLDLLRSGSLDMADSIIKCYQAMLTSKVVADVKPGFLRNQLEQLPPEDGTTMTQIINQTETKYFPGIMYWNSPKFFGYFSAQTAITNIFADMFSNAFHSAAFMYAVSPSHTELQSIVVDWTAIALGLPQVFLLKNQGGGVILNSTSQCIFVSIHAAKSKKVQTICHIKAETDSPHKNETEQNINPTPDARVLNLVGYYSEMCHQSAQKGLLLKDIYYKRVVKVRYNDKIRNYQLDVDHFRELVENDVEQGFIPFWFECTFGTTNTGSVQLSEQAVKICQQHKIWINVDAAYLGPTWVCEQFRQKHHLLSRVNSICMNFAKMWLTGAGGSVLWVNNKNLLTDSMSKVSQFKFYRNPYSQDKEVINYKDWFVGLSRRPSSLKFYYMYKHYGVKKLRELVRLKEANTVYLQKLVLSEPDVFELYTRAPCLIGFRVKNNSGQIDNGLTKEVINKTCNIEQGLFSPGHAPGHNHYQFIRISINNSHSSQQTIRLYFEKIKQAAIQSRQLQKDTDLSKKTSNNPQ